MDAIKLKVTWVILPVWLPPLAREPLSIPFTMVRWQTVLHGVGLFGARLSLSNAFYLPGGAPNSFLKGDKVTLDKILAILLAHVDRIYIAIDRAGSHHICG